MSFYSKLDPSSISNTKLFWKTVKPYFSDKSLSNENINLVDNNQIISDDICVAEIFNNFFSNAVKNLDITIDPSVIRNTENIICPIECAVERYQTHPSILKIKETVCQNKKFQFRYVSSLEVLQEIQKLDCHKSDPLYSIPSKIVKENSDFFTSILYNNINNSIHSAVFPNNLKLADVTPTYKKGGRNEKENYRPVSILPCISKIYEKTLYCQLYAHFESILSINQCGFRKGFSSQHCLIIMIEKWKKIY